MVRGLIEERGCPERRACRLIGISRGAIRYNQKIKDDEGELRQEIKEIADKKKRYGCPRVTEEIRKRRGKVNKKRIHRIWKDEGLSLSRRKRKRGGKLRDRIPEGLKAEYPNHIWSYDLLEDRTERGNRLRMLVVLDEFTRECHMILVDRSITGEKVKNGLEWLFLVHGKPKYIRSDNGTEFTYGGLTKWLDDQDCQRIYTEPGSPWQNGYVESFIGKLRDECLNCELFRNVKEAQEIVENWREEYNKYRIHSSLGYMTPEEYKVGFFSSAPLLSGEGADEKNQFVYYNPHITNGT